MNRIGGGGGTIGGKSPFGSVGKKGTSKAKIIVDQYNKPMNELTFEGFPHGLNTSSEAAQIRKTECNELTNFIIERGGRVRTRDGITKLTNTTDSYVTITGIYQVVIEGTQYILVTDSDCILYYLNTTTNNLLTICQLCTGSSGDIPIEAFKDAALIADGEELKYIDSLSSPPVQADLKMAYSYSPGYEDGHMVFNEDALWMDAIPTYYQGQYQYGVKFTTPTWTSPSGGALGIRPTAVTAYLSRVGNGFSSADTSPIYAKVRLGVAPFTVIASRIILDFPIKERLSISPLYDKFTCVFEDSDITALMYSNTSYIVSIEYAFGGTVSHCIAIQTADEGSEGTSGQPFLCTNATSDDWQDDTSDFLCLISLAPALPPKASNVIARSSRPWVTNLDKPGTAYYGNLGFKDWDTPLKAGSISAVDGGESSDSYAIGAMVPLYGDLIFIGKKNLPFIAKLTGAEPINFAIESRSKNVWTSQRIASVTSNDIMFACSKGVYTVSGVQEYGDLRNYSHSIQIQNLIDDHINTDTSFGAYDPGSGQYFLSDPSWHRTIVFSVVNAIQDPTGQGIRYPVSLFEFIKFDYADTSYFTWTAAVAANTYILQDENGLDPGLADPRFIIVNGEVITRGSGPATLNDHEFCMGTDASIAYYAIFFRDDSGNPNTTGIDIKEVFVPTSFKSVQGILYMGDHYGDIYKIEKNNIKDSNSVMEHELRTSYVSSPFNALNFLGAYLSAFSAIAANIDCYFYVNGNLNSHEDVYSYKLALNDGMTIGDLTLVMIGDAEFPIGQVLADSLFTNDLNFNGKSINIVLKNFILVGSSLSIDGIILKHKPYLTS